MVVKCADGPVHDLPGWLYVSPPQLAFYIVVYVYPDKIIAPVDIHFNKY